MKSWGEGQIFKRRRAKFWGGSSSFTKTCITFSYNIRITNLLSCRKSCCKGHVITWFKVYFGGVHGTYLGFLFCFFILEKAWTSAYLITLVQLLGFLWNDIGFLSWNYLWFNDDDDVKGLTETSKRGSLWTTIFRDCSRQW